MSPSFLSLPPEIRNQIYRELLLPPPELLMRVSGIAPSAMSFSLRRLRRFKMPLQILRTCSQISAQAKCILRGNQQIRSFPSLKQPLNPDNLVSFLDSWNIKSFYMTVPTAIGCPELKVAGLDGLFRDSLFRVPWHPCVSSTIFIIMELSEIHKHAGPPPPIDADCPIFVSEDERQTAIDVLCDYVNLVVNMKVADELPSVEHIDIEASSYDPHARHWVDAWVRSIAGADHCFEECILTPEKLYNWNWTWSVKSRKTKQQNPALPGPEEATSSIQDPKIQPASHQKLQDGQPSRSLEEKVTSILKRGDRRLSLLSPSPTFSMFRGFG